MVVALSFLILYPAGLVTVKVANHFIENQSLGFTLAAGAGLIVQYSIDIGLVLILAAIFQRFEVARDT